MALLHRILKKPFFWRFQKQWRWPQDVSRKEWDRIAIRSKSGADLSAVFAEAQTEQALGSLVLAHPMGLPAKGFWLKNGHANLFRKAGYHVLAFDFNGFGESTSSTFDFPSDVIAAGEYIKSRYPQLNVGVVGTSFGAGWSICAMSRANQLFKVAILEASFPTLADFWHRYPFPYFMLMASKMVYPAWERSLRPVLAAEKIQCQPSILLIYGEADEFTPPNHGKQLLDVLRHRADVELCIMEDVTHTKAFHDQPDLYREHVLDFLNDKLSTESETLN